MKKISKFLILILLIMASVVIYMRERTVLVYRENESLEIKAKEKEDYLKEGWFSEEVLRIYSKSGEEKIVTLSLWLENEDPFWGDEPFTPVYSEKGEEMMVPQSQKEEFLKKGWLKKRPDWEGLSDLKANIENFIKNQSGSWGVFIQNLENNEYLLINEGRYSAASLVKVYTMAGVFDEIEKGNLKKDADISHKLKLMITESSNEACNYLTIKAGGGNEAKGFDKENEISRSLGCENTERGSYLVELSGRKGPYRHHNYTSPRDCGRILKAIYNKELVSEKASEEMLSLLLGQTRRWKIPQGVPSGVKIANKTGETDTANSDIGIVFSEGADYIICVLGNGDVKFGASLISEISEMAYNYFN